MSIQPPTLDQFTILSSGAGTKGRQNLHVLDLTHVQTRAPTVPLGKLFAMIWDLDTWGIPHYNLYGLRPGYGAETGYHNQN